MLEQVEKLQTYGLDTLSEHALGRRVERWTGTLHQPDSLQRLYPTTGEAANDATFEQIVGQWRRAREPYTDGSAGDVLGEYTSLAYDAHPLASPIADSVAVEGIAPAGAESLQGAVADNMATTESAMESAMEGATDSVVGMIDGATEGVSALPADIADALEVASQAGYSAEGGANMVAEYWDFFTSVGFNLLVVGVFAVYLLCLYRYFDDVVALMHSVFRRSVILSEKVIERRRSEIFYGFLGKLFLLGVAFVGLLSLAWVYAGRGAQVGIEQPMALYALPVSIGIFLAIVLAQSILLSAVGIVTASFTMVSALIRIRLIYFVLYTLMAAPLLLVALMGSGAGYNMWLNVGIVAAAATLLLYARESIELFISKKVSILHWILYLCAVEILPLTLVWQIAIRLG